MTVQLSHRGAALSFSQGEYSGFVRGRVFFFSSLLRLVGFGSQQEEVPRQLGEVKVQIPQNDVTLHSAVPHCFRVAFAAQGCVSWGWSRLHSGARNVPHLQRKEKTAVAALMMLTQGEVVRR